MSKKRQLETTYESRVSTIQKLMASAMANEATAERDWRRALGMVYDRNGSAKTRHHYQQRPIFLACIAW